MNAFDDQAMFMRLCEQTVGVRNSEQLNMYAALIDEEYQEWKDAKTPEEAFDALLDIIVVCIGAGHSAGFPMAEGWDAVVLSNLRKVDPSSGTVLRRDDGKILKPASWRAPDLAGLLRKQKEQS